MSARRARRKDTARELAVAVARLAADRHCADIVVMDLRNVSPVTDYFVICTGTSDRQMQSLADEMADHGESIGQRVWHIAGKESADWVVLDFVDVVVHLFAEPQRSYYALELIWGSAPKVRWRRRNPSLLAKKASPRQARQPRKTRKDAGQVD